MKRKRLLVGLAVGLPFVAAAAFFLDPTCVLQGLVGREVFYSGRPASYWSKSLRSQDPSVQAESSRTLTEGGSSAVPVLVVLLKENSAGDWESTEVRWKAADLLGRLGPHASQAVGALIEALKDDDVHVRTVVAASLGALGTPPPEAVSPLIAIVELADRSSVAAAQTLALLGPEAKEAISALLVALKAKDAELRWNAARTLGKIGPTAKEAVPALIAGLRDDNPFVREHCAESLGEIGPAASVAVAQLVVVLRDPAWRVRRDAARSLGQIGPAARPAVPELTRLTYDNEVQVSKAAERSLRLLAGTRKTSESK
jgi:HEAT repeat protein